MSNTQQFGAEPCTKHLVLGGARSGKSSYAEQLAIECSLPVNKQKIYIATATADDSEMQSRISHHQQRRDDSWLLIEEKTHLADIVLRYQTPNYCLLVDCLTLWLSNCMHSDIWQQQSDAFIRAAADSSADIIMVSNEVGSGIVPLGQLSRDFVDNSGRLHQQLAQHCDLVTLVVAGLPLALKQTKL